MSGSSNRFARKGAPLQRRNQQRPRQLFLLSLLLLPAVFFLCLVLSEAHLTEDLSGWSLDRVWEHSRVSLLNVLFLKNPPASSKIPIVELNVATGAMEILQTSLYRGDPKLDHLPGGDKPYVDCMYGDESGVAQAGEACLRGRNAWHHRLRKPSLRVKLQKRKVELGRRYVELTRPEDELAMCNYLPCQLALQMGLMAQMEDHVAFYFNNAFAGVYLRGYRPDESLAQALGRLPGTFFKGDAEPGVDLWAGVEGWQLEGEDSPRTRSALAGLLRIRSARARGEDIEGLERILDIEKMARWSALNALVGSAHTDATHNQLFFLDPVRGLLEPVMWDPNGFGVFLPADAPVDLFNSPVEAMLSADPAWVQRRNLVLQELLTGIGSAEALHKRLDESVDRIRPWLQADPELSRLIRDGDTLRLEYYPVTRLPELEARTDRWIDQRTAFLRAYLDKAEVTVEAEGSGTVVTVFGRISVLAVGPGGEQRLLYPGLSKEKVQRYEGGLLNTAEQVAAPMVYHLPWPKASVVFLNGVTRQPVTPVASAPAEMPVRTVLVEPSPAPAARALVWGPGQVTLNRNQIFGPEVSLEIRPGTRLLLAPGVSLITRGVVSALGTEAEPIEIAASGAEPWGTFALLGAASKGSRFSHLTMTGGSSGEFGLVKLTAMLSVYGCPDLKLHDCVFAAGRSDDLTNLSETNFKIAGSTWRNAAADGLDLNSCRGSLDNCLFSGNAREGLELTGTPATISGCRFESNGKRGLSLGEKSRVTLKSCVFSANKKALQVKDDGMADVRECTFADNGLALDAFREKWLFRRGGEIIVTRGRFSGSDQKLAARDARSTITVHGQPVSEVAYPETGPEEE